MIHQCLLLCQGGRLAGSRARSVPPCPRRRLVFQRGKRLQYVARGGPMPYEIVLPNLAIPEDDDALRKLGDVRLVRDEHDRQPLLVELLHDRHDLDRRATVEIARWFVSKENRWP